MVGLIYENENGQFEPVPDPIAKGFWCTTCEFFEDEIYVEFVDGKCPSCGCGRGHHTEVKVVSYGNSNGAG